MNKREIAGQVVSSTSDLGGGGRFEKSSGNSRTIKCDKFTPSPGREKVFEELERLIAEMPPDKESS